jgi:hypothetical protein
MQHSRTARAIIASLLVVPVLAQGCATTGPLIGQGADPGRAALICGAGGAAVGAAAGAAIGARRGAGEALIGALIGGAIGAIVGATACFAISYKSEPVKGYQETIKEVNYQPGQGTVAQITEFRISPAVAAPGTKVSFQASYYVMAPEPEQDLSLVETRVVTAVNPSTGQRKELGRHSSQVTVKPGTRRGDGEFEVKSGVTEGKYEIVFQVEAAGQRDEKMLMLDVTKNVAALRDPSRQVAKVTVEPAGAKSEEVRPAPAAVTQPADQAPSAPAPSAADVVPPSVPSAPEPSLSTLGETRPAPPPAAQTAAATSPPAASQKLVKERYFVASKVEGKGNLRDGPGTTHNIVGEIAKGDRFVLLETVTAPGSTTPWHKIRLDNGKEAWVSSVLGDDVQE